MFTIPRAIAVASLAVFLLSCFYVGYINEQLKGTIAPLHRGIVMIGFIIGAGAMSRYIADLAHKHLPRAMQSRKARR